MVMMYKKWIRLALIYFIIVICIISLLNYKIDSSGIFGNSNYLSKAAKELVNGNMIAGLKDYDDRLFQELIIKNQTSKINAIAVGSSRTMQIRKSYLKTFNGNFFNHSVSGASLEDYISIVNIYESVRGYIPKNIIIGIDPWVFNKFNGQIRWKTLQKYYNNSINKINNTKNFQERSLNFEKWKQLIN